MARTVSTCDNGALSPRAALRRTFGGMAVFVALPLLGLGGYLIRDQFENPISSHPAGLLVAAVLIATALVLLSYVVHPGSKPAHETDLGTFEEPVCTGRTIDISASAPLALRSEHSDLRIQNRYAGTAQNAGVAAQARGMAGK